MNTIRSYFDLFIHFGKRLRITCLSLALILGLMLYGSAHANTDQPVVTVDGREVTVLEHQAQLRGAAASIDEVFAHLGPDPVVATSIEVTSADGSAIPPGDARGGVQEGKIRLANLSRTLAFYGHITVCIGGDDWRICIVIVWGSQANPVVTVDGREVRVEGVEAEVDGEPAELRRVLALLGDEPVTAELVELFDPATDDPIEAEGVGAVVQQNRIAISNLSPTLAARGRIGIWVSTSKWRICIIITIGADNNPRVTVDGRPVTAYGAEAELDGEPVEPRRLFLLLGEGPVTADKVEIVEDDETVLAENVTAVIRDGRIELTNLADQLAAKGRISIWISGSRWRICIIIEWGRFNSNDGRLTVELPAREVHSAVLFSYTEIPTPTNVLPQNVVRLLLFTLNAANEEGGEINRFDQPYRLELRYTDEDLRQLGIKEESLQIAYFDEARGEWVPLETHVDTENKIASAELDHLTEFTLWGEPDETADSVRVFLPVVNR